MMFLAHYAAMQQSPAIPNDALSDEDIVETQQRNETALKSPTADAATQVTDRVRELGGRDGPEPTRFGDWEKAGRCIDF